ncbi:hypothetical protein NADFUDRAFT_42856 [Nadsonia fulvescens var. elongata DSM 6958]|uniref:ferric-chelate reductase (NADPH) n=1 Tax=Nadsonia fulvescens var. elongata DSM 6958 TaxID=857566 RepID=A0A1E3PGK8_9ASCO|nr:hypothetical protein NADFUDRAFT_42856 [Nadsonia fulvescens var. elongata DSM 6958]
MPFVTGSIGHFYDFETLVGEEHYGNFKKNKRKVYQKKSGIFASDNLASTGYCSSGPSSLLRSNAPNYGSIPIHDSEKYEDKDNIDPHQKHQNKTYISRILNRVESFLMKQQRSPLGTDNGTIITICILLGINIFITFYKTLDEHPMILGFRMGMVSVANLPLLFILGCKHNPVTFLMGWSYEQLNIFHRHVGRICVITALGHMSVFIVYFNWNYLLNEYYLQMGFVAGLSFLLIGITSVKMARNQSYELMLMRLFWDYRLTQCCLRIENGNTIIIKVPKSKISALQNPRKSSFLNRFNFFFGRALPRWRPGQHIFLTIPSTSLFQSHPFSIASNFDYNKDGTLDLIVRVREGFTRKLMDNLSKELANNLPGEQVWKWCVIHGPYGIEPNGIPTIDSLISMPQSIKQNIILVSGGAGISYTYPLLLEYLNNERLRQRQIERINIHDSKSDQCSAQNHLENIHNVQILLFWIIPNRSFMNWVDFKHYQDKLNECLDGNHYDESGPIKACGLRVKLKIWVTAELGRPDVEMELRDMISRDDPKISNSCTVNSGGGSDDGCARNGLAQKVTFKQVNSWIGVCGPKRLVYNCRNTAAKLKAEGLSNIDFYSEQFGW